MNRRDVLFLSTSFLFPPKFRYFFIYFHEAFLIGEAAIFGLYNADSLRSSRALNEAQMRSARLRSHAVCVIGYDIFMKSRRLQVIERTLISSVFPFWLVAFYN
jgi:hypothetical protein